VKYYISTGYLDTREIVEIATAADELGYDALGIPDHVVNLESLSTPYPYTRDGTRRWAPFTDWPDPWVLIGALAQCTQRLHFVTTVYVAALRDPYSAAKSIGTAALLAGGRVELGLGVGWCAEEFELLNARFDRRGRRTDETIALMRTLWSPGWTEFHGEFYRTPRLEMSPAPPPIPIWVGGLTDVALRRAARYDGWVGDLITTDDAIAVVERLRGYRDQSQRSDREFAVLAPLVDAVTAADYHRAERGGVTHILTMPWMFYSGRDATLAEKVDAMKRFREDLGLDVQR
jgi:probable F420-dependent oxidoreductase